MTWRTLPIKALYRRREQRDCPQLPLLSVYRDLGVVPRAGREDNFNKPGEDLSAYKLVRPHDLVVNKMKTWQGSLGVSEFEGIVSPAYFVAEPTSNVDRRFMHHLLRSKPLIAQYGARSKGIRPSQWDLPWGEFASIAVRVPEAPLQRAIADFLDAETARIDALISKKRRLVELLDERGRDSIEHLVLGLSERSSRRATSEFFRTVPSSWTETTLRHLDCEVQTGPFGSQLHSDEYVVGGWPVVNPQNLLDGRIVAMSEMAVSEEKRSELARHVLRIGDIVFGRRGEMGRSGLVGEENEGWLCGTGSLRLRLNNSPLRPEYLQLLLRTQAMRRYFGVASIGSTMDNLNSDIVLSMPCVVPSPAEQMAIAKEVRAREGAATRTRGLLVRQIDLLIEHRQALITAAVTGELEIPGVAA